MNYKISLNILLVLISGYFAEIIAGPIPENHPPVNSLSAGMGLCGVANHNSPVTIFWNPSGLNRMEQMGLDFTVAAPTVESPGSWSFLLANASEAQDSRLGFGMVRHHATSQDHTYKSFATILPFSHSFMTGKVPFGFSLKLISESIDENDWKFGMSVDIGAMWSHPSGFKFGVTTANIGGSNLQAFNNKSWFGVYWDNNISPFSFSSQFRAERPFDSDYINHNFGVGVNYKLIDLPFDEQRVLEASEIRSGWIKVDSRTYYTFGFDFGQTKNDTYLGYAVIIDAKSWSGRTHYITYGYRYAAEKHKRSHGGTPFSSIDSDR